MFPICKRDFWAMITRKHLGCECRKKSADGSSQQLKSFYHQLPYMRLLRCALERVVCGIVKGWLHVMHDSFACVHSHGSWVETCRTRVRIPGGQQQTISVKAGPPQKHFYSISVSVVILTFKLRGRCERHSKVTMLSDIRDSSA